VRFAALQIPAGAYAIGRESYSDNGDVSGQPIQFWQRRRQDHWILDGGGTGTEASY